MVSKNPVLAPQQASDEHESMAAMAHRSLEEMIVTLQLPPGSRWSEAALSDMTGIGRTPVREAVKQLQADYLVKIVPRHGLMIAEINVQEQMLVIEFRRELELFISTRAARRALSVDRVTLSEKADNIEKGGRAGDMVGYLREVFEANKLLAQCAGNPFAASSISPLHALSRRFYYKYHADVQNLYDMGILHAARIRSVVEKDEKRTEIAVNALMDKIESYTRDIFSLNYAPR